MNTPKSPQAGSTPEPYTGKAAEILDAAERHMRRGGFDAVSFRELAAEVGIKSASVHYYFPQKADLVEAVVNRYAARLLAHLGSPDDPGETVPTRIARLCAVYRAAVMDDCMICLCCVLGGEVLRLPPPVAAAITGFFDRLMTWTETALKSAGPNSAQPSAASPSLNAAHIVASLQGAMILAISSRQPELFTQVEESLVHATGP